MDPFSNNGQETHDDCLPDYNEMGDLSGPYPLTSTDCHKAMQSTIHKARLIGFEIALRKEPFLKRKFKKDITLQGDPREFDVLLFETSDQFGVATNIGQPVSIIDWRLRNLLRTLLGVDKDFNESSAKLKRSVLRIEKDFGQNVVEPLKKALINRSTPDYPNLKGHVTHCHQQTMTALELWQKEAQKVVSKVMASEAWHEATELNKEIHDLLGQAEKGYWRPWLDKKFKKLDERHAFQRPDGPSSIIAYLNSVLNSDKHQSPITQRGPSIADLRAGEVGTRRENYIGRMLRSSTRKRRPVPSESRPSRLKKPLHEGKEGTWFKVWYWLQQRPM